LRLIAPSGLIPAMNLVRLFRIPWATFLLSLVLLSLNGCTTEGRNAAANKDLEKYRKVYLVRPKGDEEDLTAGVLARLKAAGFDASEVDTERLKKIAAQESAQPALVCRFDYVISWSYDRTWYTFVSVDLEFSDIQKDQMVYKASRNNYKFENVALPENTQLNHLFVKIRDAFFPGQPNPFRDNPKAQFGPAHRKFQTDI